MKEMKDLFVYTADADALGVMRAILGRPRSLGIRPITFDVDRHSMKDPGMVTSGPELARLHKDRYEKLLLLWDHEGSGWEQKGPTQAVAQIAQRLDGVTWKSHSSAVAIDPELEEWLWRNPASIAAHLGITPDAMAGWIAAFEQREGLPSSTAMQRRPKELLHRVFTQATRRRPMPRDYEHIAGSASLRDWRASSTFDAVAATLQRWFP